MTITTNARIAGVTYFVYLAGGVASAALAGRPQVGEVLAMVTSFAVWLLTKGVGIPAQRSMK